MSQPRIGRKWASELKVGVCPVSGATGRQLTDYRSHSNHAYFTYPCWYDNGRRLVIVSDRENAVNLYGVELATGELTQLTDWDPSKISNRSCLSKNPAREEICVFYDGAITVVDLVTLKSRRLMDLPEGYRSNQADFTADGRYICTGFNEDLSGRISMDLGHGYVGFEEYWAAAPRSTVWKIPVDGGRPEMVLEDNCWLGHFNASPTLPNIMTFCHEGPWDRVDHRIWGLDLDTGRAWRICESPPGTRLGHEYWMADGERIGYHGNDAEGGFFGSIRYDNSDDVKARFDDSCWCWHFHSQTPDFVVGDGNAAQPYLLAWRLRDGRYEGPKVLGWHRGSFHSQCLHVHPRVHDEGRKVLCSADPQGYGQVFIVDVPSWESMPDLADIGRAR